MTMSSLLVNPPNPLRVRLFEVEAEGANILVGDILDHVNRGHGSMLPVRLIEWAHDLLTVSGQLAERSGDEARGHQCRSDLAKVTVHLPKRSLQ